MAGLLEGIKVVSMSTMVAGPSAGAWLADMGAEVIKIEPLSGEAFRGTTRAQGTTTVASLRGGDIKYGFELVNRNTKGMALDLRNEAGRDILYRLIQKADVFMSNYQLEALQKLKLDYATLSQLNPRLVYAFLSGYGTVGPDKDMPGYDWTASWAHGGFQYLISEPGSNLAKQRPGQGDMVAGSHAVAGILAALLYRERTGKGQELESSLFHSAVWTLAFDIQGTLAGTPRARADRTRAGNPLSNLYRTKDGRWLSLGMHVSDPFWPRFSRAMGSPELENDPRFNNARVRGENCEELVSILDEAFASKDIDEWEKIFREHHFIFSRVQSPEEIIADPQALANDFFVDLHHPAGQLKTVASPVKFKQNPASVRGPAPELGQHTEEILLELGYSWDDIARLKEQKVIL